MGNIERFVLFTSFDMQCNFMCHLDRMLYLIFGAVVGIQSSTFPNFVTTCFYLFVHKLQPFKIQSQIADMACILLHKNYRSKFSIV